MAVAARSWEHPRWQYDERGSAAARRSEARAAERNGTVAAEKGTLAPSQRASRPAARVETRATAAAAPRLVPKKQTFVGSIVVVAAALALALLMPVALNTLVVGTEVDIARLQKHTDDLIADRSALRAQQASLSSTQRVKEAADRLGMVKPASVSYIEFGSSGGVAGSAGASLAPSSATASVAAVVGIAGVRFDQFAEAAQSSGESSYRR